MLPWMVAYDNNRYGRWLPNFWAMLTALPDDQVAFLRTDFTQSITGNPYSNIAWDMWIECTMNKGSKILQSFRMRSSFWCTLEMWTMWHRSGQLSILWPTEQKPRGSTQNAALNECNKMSSAYRTWLHVWMSLNPSRSTQPHLHSAPCSQPRLLLEKRSWHASCKSGCSVRINPSMHLSLWANDWHLARRNLERTSKLELLRWSEAL